MHIPVNIELGCKIICLYYFDGKRDHCSDFIHGIVRQIDPHDAPDPKIEFDFIDQNRVQLIGKIGRHDIAFFTFGGVWQQNPDFKKPRNYLYDDMSALLQWIKDMGII